MEEEEIPQRVSPATAASHRWLLGATLLMFSVAMLSSVYLLRERRRARELAASNDRMNAALSQTRNELDALKAKFNALSAAPVTEPSPSALRPLAARSPRRAITRAHVKPRPAEDPRWKQIQAELAEHQKQIAATQQDIEKTRSELQGNLKSTRDELGGQIARNHDELVALEKRGERNYYEFDLMKSKQFQHAGPVGISLRKANTKRQYCDLEMLVDDIQLAKKHVNLYEPVLFYPEGYAQALELVVNRIEKNQIHGYVSEPKYKQSELTASAPAAPAAASSPPAPAPLEHRPENPR